MIELNNCPFCNGKAFFNTKSSFNNSGEVGYNFSIKCSKCNLEYPKLGLVSVILKDNGTLEYIADQRLDIANEWNKRSGKAEKEKENEET